MQCIVMKFPEYSDSANNNTEYYDLGVTLRTAVADGYFEGVPTSPVPITLF